MNDLITGCKVEGKVIVDGKDIYDKDVDVVDVRKRIGMVFQKPNPFPKSIFENIAYAPRIHGIADRERRHPQGLEERAGGPGGVVAAPRRPCGTRSRTGWTKSAYNLSGGQQQRLCIARTLAIKPEIILFDEPCSALDPIATAKIEDLLIGLKNDYTVLIVTHNMQQSGQGGGQDRLLLPGRPDRVRRDEADIREPEEGTDRTVHHWQDGMRT